jgi:hypothetical protein
MFFIGDFAKHIARTCGSRNEHLTCDIPLGYHKDSVGRRTSMYMKKDPEKSGEAKAKKTAKVELEKPKKAMVDARLVATSTKASAKAQGAQEQRRAQPEGLGQEDPVTALRALFAQMDLPQKLVPSNVANYNYDPASGSLLIQLKSSFSKQFDAENTVTFEKEISGVLRKGSLTGITGIKRGSASITSIERSRPGIFAITGKLGPFSKKVEFKDESVPDMP